MPKVSICIPAHKEMKNHDFFLNRLMDSIKSQTFTDYEVVLTYDGKMAENTNSAMRQAKGDIIKLFYMDDYFTDYNSLADIVRMFDANPENVWLASGCVHDDGSSKFLNPHLPSWNSGMLEGNNSIGSPSVVSLKNGLDIYFDERLSFLLDCDFYHRLYQKHGAPIFLNTLNVTMGLGDHQTTNLMSDAEKGSEFTYLTNKYA